ncbi:hypothetical protein [Clostridium chrysemydis]|uniref:hypothetical protein n=1 Tax=Clostridium chrysemydis TaxID=2665504 RepID=UPI0018839B26|nr:hypothetical protein [Clostridium chrysemydis]
MTSNVALKDFIVALISSNGHKTIESICTDIYYHKDYLTKLFKKFTHRNAQNYMNYCRVICVLYDFISGINISFARKKYHYTENSFNKALHVYNFPSIRKVKGDSKMKELIIKEYKKIKLISILSSNKNPIKAKELGDLCIYIREFRNSKEFCICSKPGPKGGYYLSTNTLDIALCENWIRNWRKSMNIDGNFSIAYYS